MLDGHQPIHLENLSDPTPIYESILKTYLRWVGQFDFAEPAYTYKKGQAGFWRDFVAYPDPLATY